MICLECENCGTLIDHDPVEEFVALSSDDPDFVTFSLICLTCGHANVIGQMPADERDNGDLMNDVPYILDNGLKNRHPFFYQLR